MRTLNQVPGLYFGLLALTPVALAQFPYRVPPMNAEDAAIAAPTVVKRNFTALNAAHKIVVGVWGTGIDYNQPLLYGNIHFDTSESGTAKVAGGPVGVGIDFTEDDHLASYHVVNTDLYPFAALDKETRDDIEVSQDPAIYDARQAEKSDEWACSLGLMKAADPRVGKYLALHRNSEYELKAASESTRVAGLITGGQGDVGIVPYRVRPYAKTKAEVRAEALGDGAVETEQLAKVMDDIARPSYEGKIKIVFLDTSATRNPPVSGSSVNAEVAREMYERSMKVLGAKYEEEIRRHPEILFVTYPYQKAGWSDNSAIIQYPCGLAADNLLCVGRIDANGNIAADQEIPLNPEAQLIFTHASSQQTTDVWDQCEDIVALAGNFTSDDGDRLCEREITKGAWTGKWIPEKALTEDQAGLLKATLDECQSIRKLFVPAAAVPAGARAAAEMTRVAAKYWVAHPELKKGADVVQGLLKQSQCHAMGELARGCALPVDSIDWKQVMADLVKHSAPNPPAKKP